MCLQQGSSSVSQVIFGASSIWEKADISTANVHHVPPREEKTGILDFFSSTEALDSEPFKLQTWC